ncbi:hypothetical protein Pyrfu_0139 [Pyrolobus fumarii 1A]|uniref:Uncharacterized protein n=1 Tax=Pyrolobus fumarii (strain DSM 11204 / 1A) TaxID=694429 RepID=G0EEH0_PYRF1|nr:hypothetical protein [Pyrolobus fumarii]AEM38011.1 hypothetical protein Pyrfu_0139 [Pyrolobus fumarii 1A]
MNIEELKRMLERKIAFLEKKLEFYRMLLEALEACSEGGASLIEEIRDEEGRLVGRVYRSGNTLKLILEKPVHISNPYVRHLARRIERLREEGIELELSLEKNEQGMVTSIVVRGPLESDEILETLQRLFRFVALRVSRGNTANA